MQRRNGIPQRSPYQPERKNIASCPALIFPRKLIETAFADAKRTDGGGEPTQLALNALDWIMGKTDWTSLAVDTREELWRQPSPPEDIRKQFYGTFDWCCQYLNYDPNEVRRVGLPNSSLANSDGSYFNSSDSGRRTAGGPHGSRTGIRSTPAVRNSYSENHTLGGVATIYETWQKRKRVRGTNSFVTAGGL